MAVISQALEGNRLIITVFILASLFGALAEGLGLSMIVPLLEAQGNSRIFSDAPLFGQIGALLEGYDVQHRLRITAMVLLGAVLIRGVLQFTTMFLTAYVPLRLQKRLAQETFDILMTSSTSYVESQKSGDLIYQLQGIPTRVATTLNALAMISWNLALLFVYFIFMLLISVEFTLYCMVFSVLFSFAYMKLSLAPLRAASVRITKASQDWYQHQLEAINGFRFIKLLSAERDLNTKQARSLKELIDVATSANVMSALPQPLMMCSAGLFIAALIVVVSYEAAEIPSRIAQLLLFLAILTRLIGPVSVINSMRASIQSNLNALEAHADFISEVGANAARLSGNPVEALQSGIRLDHVSFAYPGGSVRAISNIDFEIEKGSMVAIVGRSGSGKSTIVSLLAGLYEPGGGKILIDGVDLREIDLKTWRKHVSIVSQDLFVFNDTIRNNLVFGLDGIDDEQIRKALDLASAQEFVDELEDGLETVIGERGVRLSGGQRQRLAIARAVLADPDLLILDEATSQLDSLTEKAIQAAIDAMRSDRTLLVIAHRLSTIQDADRIVVLDDGHVVETGRHEDLMGKTGIYTELLSAHQIGPEAHKRSLPA